METNLISALVASAFLAGATDVLAHEDGIEKLGNVRFSNSCKVEVQPQFQRGVALLHSFWYAEGAKTFAAVAKTDPACAMAHWGTAITLFNNPFTWPLTGAALPQGWAAVERAKAANAKTQRERDYIGAIEAFYKDADKVDHRTRALGYLKAMERITERYPRIRKPGSSMPWRSTRRRSRRTRPTPIN